MMEDDILERIGSLVGMADNYRMYSEEPLRNLGDTAIDAMGHGFTKIRTEARAIYIALGGDADTWGDNDV